MCPIHLTVDIVIIHKTMSTKAKTKKSKKSVKKSPTSSKKKVVKSVSKSKTKKEVIKPVLPPICECYNNNECEFHYDETFDDLPFSDESPKDSPVNMTYYYAVNHTTKIKALITGEELPYDYAVTVAERVTEDTSSPETENIYVTPIGPVLYWFLKKVFKIREYEL